MRTKVGSDMARKHFTKEYLDYIKSPAWQAKRLEIIERDSHRCTSCGNRGILQVHHRNYRRLGNERPEDLITLCLDCHKALHKRTKTPVEPQLVKVLPKKRSYNKKGNKTAGWGCASPRLLKIPIEEWRAKYGRSRRRYGT